MLRFNAPQSYSLFPILNDRAQEARASGNCIPRADNTGGVVLVLGEEPLEKAMVEGFGAKGAHLL